MLSNGQIWKNGTKIAQINFDEQAFKAVIFKINKEKLSFSKIIDVTDEQVLFNSGFKPTDYVLVCKEN